MKNEKYDENNHGINSYFESNGFDSMMVINNVGSAFVYAVIYSSVLLIFQIMKKLRLTKIENFT